MPWVRTAVCFCLTVVLDSWPCWAAAWPAHNQCDQSVISDEGFGGLKGFLVGVDDGTRQGQCRWVPGGRRDTRFVGDSLVNPRQE